MGNHILKGKRFNNNKSRELLYSGKHVPNRQEKKVLRRIMSQTGLSEEEIREVKKYRIELSESQKSSSINSYQRIKKTLLKKVTKELKLPKEHPKTFKRYNEVWVEYWNNRKNVWETYFETFLEENQKTVGLKRNILIEKNIFKKDGSIITKYKHILRFGRSGIRL